MRPKSGKILHCNQRRRHFRLACQRCQPKKTLTVNVIGWIWALLSRTMRAQKNMGASLFGCFVYGEEQFHRLAVHRRSLRSGNWIKGPARRFGCCRTIRRRREPNLQRSKKQYVYTTITESLSRLQAGRMEANCLGMKLLKKWIHGEEMPRAWLFQCTRICNHADAPGYSGCRRVYTTEQHVVGKRAHAKAKTKLLRLRQCDQCLQAHRAIRHLSMYLGLVFIWACIGLVLSIFAAPSDSQCNFGRTRHLGSMAVGSCPARWPIRSAQQGPPGSHSIRAALIVPSRLIAGGSASKDLQPKCSVGTSPAYCQTHRCMTLP